MENIKGYILIDEKEYVVKSYSNTTVPEIDTAYIIKDQVLLYRGELDDKKNATKNGLYKINGKYAAIGSKSDKLLTSDIFQKVEENSIDTSSKGFDPLSLLNDIENNKNVIIQNNNNIVLTDEEKKDIFAPPIQPLDNTLVVLVKTWLIDKQLTTKELRHLFNDDMDLNNYKRALLINKGKMSYERFMKWATVLNVEFNITYEYKK